MQPCIRAVHLLQSGQLTLALLGVAKSSTGISFGWDKGSYTLFDMISANPNHNNSNVTPKSLLGHAHLCCSGPLRVVTVDFSIN